ncbi:hypothetical protein Tco_1153639 [Tanacetum coccineum]
MVRNEKRIMAIEDSNSKALVATDKNDDIDWTKEFDAEPRDNICYDSALTEKMDLMHFSTGATMSDVHQYLSSLSAMAYKLRGNSIRNLKDYAIIDSGCSGSRQRQDKLFLYWFKEIKGEVMWLMEIDF